MTHPFSRTELFTAEIHRLTSGMKGNTGFSADYLAAATVDLPQMIDFVRSAAEPADSTLQPTKRLVWIPTDELVVDAYALQGRSECEFGISLGALLAIEDLVFRACCNEDFFSFDVSRGVSLWQGCQCLWLQWGRERPRTRFYDYHSVQARDIPIDSEDSSLSRMFRAVPLDRARMLLATHMSVIALMWLAMHEEGHYRLGHLHYRAKDTRLGAHPIRETLGTGTGSGDDFLHRAFEWQADRHAIAAVVDVYLRPSEYGCLPHYCPQTPSWLLRIALTSAGMMILVLAKAQSVRGTTLSYPSLRTRFVTAIICALGRITAPWWPGPFRLSEVDLHEAVSGALYDVGVAAELIFDEGEFGPLDGTDFGHSTLSDAASEGRFVWFESPEELVELLAEIFHPRYRVNGPKAESMQAESSALRRKWLAEFEELLQVGNGILDEQLAPFRAAAVHGAR